MRDDSVPVLRSPRLRLRPIAAVDAADLLALAHDIHVTRYLHEGAPPSAEEQHGRIARGLEQWALRGYGMMTIADAGGFVGRMGVFHPAAAAEPLLVYALRRRSWGQGYATEAVPVILRWLRAAHGFEELSAHIDPRNVGSLRVAAKLGAVHRGTVGRAGVDLDRWVFPT